MPGSRSRIDARGKVRRSGARLGRFRRQSKAVGSSGGAPRTGNGRELEDGAAMQRCSCETRVRDGESKRERERERERALCGPWSGASSHARIQVVDRIWCTDVV